MLIRKNVFLAYFPKLDLYDLLPICVSVCIPLSLLGNRAPLLMRGKIGLEVIGALTEQSIVLNIVFVVYLFSSNTSDQTKEGTLSVAPKSCSVLDIYVF
jgi:hypothetical protein